MTARSLGFATASTSVTSSLDNFLCHASHHVAFACRDFIHRHGQKESFYCAGAAYCGKVQTLHQAENNLIAGISSTNPFSSAC